MTKGKMVETREEKVFWNMLRLVYKLLATNEAQKIINELLQAREPIRTIDLRKKTGLEEFQFHPIMKQLVKYGIVERYVHEDRSVSYVISPFGKNVLKLTEPLLAKIKENIKLEIIAKA